MWQLPNINRSITALTCHVAEWWLWAAPDDENNFNFFSLSEKLNQLKLPREIQGAVQNNRNRSHITGSVKHHVGNSSWWSHMSRDLSLSAVSFPPSSFSSLQPLCVSIFLSIAKVLINSPWVWRPEQHWGLQIKDLCSCAISSPFLLLTSDAEPPLSSARK